MNAAKLIFFLSFLVVSSNVFAQEFSSVDFNISVDPELQTRFKNSGRLFLFLSENPQREPRSQLWPISTLKNHIFAKNITDWKPNDILKISAQSNFSTTAKFNFDAVPNGKYYVQALWDHDISESGITSPGILYSNVKTVEINKNLSISLELNMEIPPPKLVENKFVKFFEIQSDTLSAWWGKPVKVKASVLLPSGYFENSQTNYPVRYNIAGYGGRFTRVNYLVESKDFSEWWFSKDAPQIINVFLDGEGPFGDTYHLDSENNGPYGYSLVNELIPAIENEFRAIGSAKMRFTDGCSTGGWVSLALQLFYPDVFNGVWSYSPDAVDFENYQLINIYNNKNAFYNEWGNLRPVARDLTGDPIITMKVFIQYENILGASNSYLDSGGQFNAHAAVYSSKGENGLPTPLFDPVTGEIDSVVAQYWQKYDLKRHLEKNWEKLGPKLQGKIFIWMGDMDHFYLNPATRALHEFLQQTENPKSDVIVKFDAMEGHCSKYSHKEVLQMMAERIQKLK